MREILEKYNYTEDGKPQESSGEVFLRLEQYRVSFDEVIPTETPCFGFDIDGEQFHIGTVGNFSCVTGKAKSRKSFFVSLLVERALDETEEKIIVFDTEQSRGRVQECMRRIPVMKEYDYRELEDKLEYYNLRKEPPENRIKLIEDRLYFSQGIKYVFIDGVSDLVKSINSEEEATEVVSKLLKWTEELNIHICVILHENPSNDKVRGHIGTEVMNKSQSTVIVEKEDKSVSTVKPKFMRGKDFTPFQFRIDERELPVVMGHFKETKEKKANAGPYDHESSVRFQIAKEAMQGRHLKYEETRLAIQTTAEQHGIKFGVSNSKKWITALKDKDNFLLQDEDSKLYFFNETGLLV